MNYLGFPSSSYSGSTDWLNVDSDIVPTVTDTYDVGRPAKRFRNGEFVNVISDSVDSTIVNTDTISSTTNISDTFVKNGGTGAEYLMADGSTTTGSNSGQNIYPYVFSTAVSGIPANTRLRVNNAVMPSATEVVMSHLDADNIDIDVFLALIDSTSILYIQDLNNSANYIKYSVVSSVSVPNSHTTCTVTYMTAEGTGLTNFPNNHQIFMSVFTNGASIDSRLSSLENKTANQSRSTTLTQFTNTLACTGNIACDIIDSLAGATLFLGTVGTTDLEIGKVGSSATFDCAIFANRYDSLASTILSLGQSSSNLQIGNATAIVAVNGPSCNVATRLTTPLIDTLTPTQLNFGTVNATSINIGNGSITTIIFGSSCNIGTRLNSPLIDRATIGTLSIGSNATTSGIAIGNGSIITSITGASTDIVTRLNTPLLDRAAAGSLSIGTSANTTGISIGNGSVITAITGASTDIATRLNVPQLDRATAGALAIGTSTNSTSITIGNSSIATAINGGQCNIQSRCNAPLFDTQSISTLQIGTASQSGLTIGRIASNTTINSLALVLNTTPFIVANSSAGSRPVICRWTMTPTLATQVAAQALTTTGFGSVAFTTLDAYNTIVVGSCFRYKFNGYLQNMSSGSTLAIALTHAGGTQNIFNITFSSVTSAGFIKGEFYITFPTVGAAISPSLTGFVDYQEGLVSPTMKNVCIQVNAWSPLFNTTVSNAMTCATVVSGSTVQHVINNFTVEQLR